MKYAILGLTLLSTTAGCMTVGNDGGSYVGNHVRGTETNAIIKQACSFDQTVIAGAVVGGIALLLGADVDDALAAGAVAGAVQNGLSQEACSRAQAAVTRANSNPGQQYSWVDPSNSGNRGTAQLVPIAGTSNGWLKEVGTINGKPYDVSRRVSLS